MKDNFLCTREGGFFMPKVRKEISELEKLVQTGRKKFVRYEEGAKLYGVLTPVLLRMDDNEEYEMVSGHRKMHAAQLAGLTTIPAIVRELSDDDAIWKRKSFYKFEGLHKYCAIT